MGTDVDGDDTPSHITTPKAVRVTASKTQAAGEPPEHARESRRSSRASRNKAPPPAADEGTHR